jgi:uncharacterized membrane protein
MRTGSVCAVSAKPQQADTNAPSPAPGKLADQIAQNVTTIAALLHQEREASSTPAQRRLEQLGRFLGKPSYLTGLLVLVLAWIAFNAIAHALGLRAVDRPPFQWLQGMLTLIAMLTSTTVLIAQNREERLEKQREHLELQINLLTEQKVTRLISLLEELRRDLPMVHNRHDPETARMQEATDTAQVISALKQVGMSAEEGAAGAAPDGEKADSNDEKGGGPS